MASMAWEMMLPPFERTVVHAASVVETSRSIMAERSTVVHDASVPVLKPKEVTAILRTLGFVRVRQKGSHARFRHPDGRTTTVPLHIGRDISPTLLRQIAKDIGMTSREFVSCR